MVSNSCHNNYDIQNALHQGWKADIHNHSCEYFDFISINEKLFDAKEYFNHSIKNDKRLALLFVTKNGKDNQEILGLLTPWDLL